MTGGDLQQGFRVGDWLVEPQAKRLTGPSGSHALTQPEVDALLCLASRPDDVVDLATLAAAAWGGAAGAERVLPRTMEHLRRLLGDTVDAPTHILEVPGRGYALIAPVAPLAAAPTPDGAPPAVPLTPAPDVRPTPAPEPPFPVSQPPAHAAAPPSDPPPPPVAESGPVRRVAQSLQGSWVIRVTTAYFVAAWLIIQIAVNTFPALHIPLWGQTLVIVLLVLGYPLTLILIWARERPEEGESSASSVRRRRVRRIARIAVVPLALVLLGGAGLTWWNWLQGPDWAIDPGPSIAVLPLLDLSPEGSSGYLGDGLSEELSSRLAQVPGLRVASRTSSFAYRGQDIDVREIGQTLGVRYVLEGSVRRDGDRVRVTVQLIDAESGFHRWTESFDRDWRDLLRLQQEISTRITSELKLVLTPEQQESLTRLATNDPRAYDYYLAGLSQLRQGRTLTSLDKARAEFTRALEVDPGFARAYAGLCETDISRYGLTKDSAIIAAAEESCRKALETDASLLETELALARLYVASGRHAQARNVFDGVLARNPGNADALVGLGEALEGEGDLAGAEASFREAVEVEPGYWGNHNALGRFLFRHGRADEAIDAYTRVTLLRPASPTGFNNLGAALLMAGQLDPAARAFEKSAGIEPSRAAYNNLAYIYYYQRRYADAADLYRKAAALAKEDHAVWGGLADSLWQLPERREEARETYRRAILLAEKNLAVDATDAETWAQVGYYYGRVGDAERSQRYLARGAELGPQLPMVAMYLAYAAADRGEIAAAVTNLERAFKLGISPGLSAKEPNFDALQRDQRFRALVAPPAPPPP